MFQILKKPAANKLSNINYIVFILLLVTNITLVNKSTASNELPFKGLMVSSQPLYLLAKEATKGVEKPRRLFKGKDLGHHHSISPSTIMNIKNANFIVWLGETIESPLLKVLKQKQNAWAILAVDKLKIKKQRRLDGKTTLKTKDPHVWLDPLTAQAIVHGIAASRAKLYPNYATKYRQNANSFTKKVNAMLQKQTSKKIHYIAYHDAYQYAEGFLGLSYVGALTFEPEDPVKPKQYKYLIESIKLLEKKNKPICFFISDKKALDNMPDIFAKYAVVIDEKMNKANDYISAMKEMQIAVANCKK